MKSLLSEEDNKKTLLQEIKQLKIINKEIQNKINNSIFPELIKLTPRTAKPLNLSNYNDNLTHINNATSKQNRIHKEYHHASKSNLQNLNPTHSSQFDSNFKLVSNPDLTNRRFVNNSNQGLFLTNPNISNEKGNIENEPTFHSTRLKKLNYFSSKPILTNKSINLTNSSNYDTSKTLVNKNEISSKQDDSINDNTPKIKTIDKNKIKPKLMKPSVFF